MRLFQTLQWPLFFLSCWALSSGCSSGVDASSALAGGTAAQDSASENAAKLDSWYQKAIAPTDPQSAPVIVAPDLGALDRLLGRGTYLAKGPAACGFCHGADPANPESPLLGGRLMKDRFGQVHAANITPDPSSGIGSWNISDIKRALRSSIGRNGEPLSLDAHQAYRWMSDYDATALAVYILSRPAVRSSVERRELSGFSSKSWGIFSQHQDIKGYVPAFVEKPLPQYGRYLASNVSGCVQCHTPSDTSWFSTPEAFSGTDVSEEISDNDFPLKGPDIRGSSESGLKNWKEEDIVNYLSSGKRPDGKTTKSTLCPWSYFRNMSEQDKHAVAMYLRTQ